MRISAWSSDVWSSDRVLPPAERARIRGYVVNKFRGHPTLFDDGLTTVPARPGWPSLGVVPFLPDAAKLPAEDAVALDQPAETRAAPIRIAVLQFSRIANHDDFDPLRLEPDVALTMIRPGRALPGDVDLVVLPGTKSTAGDLAFLRAQGWDVDIAAHLRRGGRVLGICRSEKHTSELQSLMRISYAVFCLKKTNQHQ